VSLGQRLVDARLRWASRRPSAGHSPRRVRRIVARAAAHDERRRRNAAASVRHLHRAERSVFSQNGEDGVIAEILRRIGSAARTFVELGAADGTENCTRALLEQGWSGVWVEGDPGLATAARRVADGTGVEVVSAFVDRDNVAAIVGATGIGPEPDVLVIDLDGNDWSIWQALGAAIRPRVVVVEYNGAMGPRLDWRLPYDPAHRWDGTARFGASLAAWVRLGAELGYVLVGCDSAGVNAFFVRAEDAHHFDQRTPAQHYAPPQHAVGGHPWARPAERAFAPLPEDAGVALELDRVWAAPAPGAHFHVTAWVANHTGVPVGAPGEAAVHLAWRWHGDDGEPQRALGLAWSAEPGARALLACRPLAPAEPGSHRLELALVQEGVRWLPEPGRMTVPVDVRAPASAIAEAQAA
jgi:hypothetical protein